METLDSLIERIIASEEAAIDHHPSLCSSTECELHFPAQNMKMTLAV